jgi:hypothetical protein
LLVCDESKVKNVLGRARSEALGKEAMRAAGARLVRWIEPNSSYTMDYRSDRINLQLDAQNRVMRVTCG